MWDEGLNVDIARLTQALAEQPRPQLKGAACPRCIDCCPAGMVPAHVAMPDMQELQLITAGTRHLASGNRLPANLGSQLNSNAP